MTLLSMKSFRGSPTGAGKGTLKQVWQEDLKKEGSKNRFAEIMKHHV